MPNVKVVGYVTDHDLAYLMDRALCLVFPSWTEGFGLPIVEAMARAVRWSHRTAPACPRYAAMRL